MDVIFVVVIVYSLSLTQRFVSLACALYSSQPNVLMMHNLNVVMVACEMYFGRSTVDIEDIGIAPVFGLVYVAFSWWWAPRAQPESGPQYMYFFLDTSLPDKTVGEKREKRGFARGAKRQAVAHKRLLRLPRARRSSDGRAC